MRNLIKNIFFFLTAIAFFSSCEEDTLDRNFTSNSDINYIVIEVSENEPLPSALQSLEVFEAEEKVSGLTPTYSALTTDTNITVSSSSKNEDVAERIWTIPSISSTGAITSMEVNTLDPIKNLNFPVATQGSGLQFDLKEILKDGSIHRYTTNLKVRQPVKAVFEDAPQSTNNEIVTFKVDDLSDLGLEESDMNTNNQTILVWTFSGAYSINGELVSNRPDGETFKASDILPVEVVYINVGSFDVSLDVLRNFPAKSFTKQPYKSTVNIVDGSIITPEFIELNTTNNELLVIYGQEISNVSSVSTNSFNLNYSYVNGATGIMMDVNIPITKVENSPTNSNAILLTLGASIPAYSSSTELTYTFAGIETINGEKQLGIYEKLPVASDIIIPEGTMLDLTSQVVGEDAAITALPGLTNQVIDAESSVTITDEEINPLFPSETKSIKMDRAANKDHNAYFQTLFTELDLEAGDYKFVYSAKASREVLFAVITKEWQGNGEDLTTEWKTYSTKVQTISGPDDHLWAHFQFSNSLDGAYTIYLNGFHIVKVSN